jgi:hypothetical protein
VIIATAPVRDWEPSAKWGIQEIGREFIGKSRFSGEMTDPRK